MLLIVVRLFTFFYEDELHVLAKRYTFLDEASYMQRERHLFKRSGINLL